MTAFQRLEGATEEVWRSLLGRKVSIRYRLRDDPEHDVSEVIGIVMSIKSDETDGIEISIVDKRGEITKVAIDDVMAGKAWVEGT
jgi:PDZ domain-containing secreted protein